MRSFSGTHPRVYLWLLFIILDLHKLIQRVHIYIYILYPSPHCPSRARNDVDIYIELFYQQSLPK